MVGRKIKVKTIEDIIRRDKREIRNGRRTYYTITHYVGLFDDKEFARLKTKNKIYFFKRNPCLKHYRLIDERYKNQLVLNI